MVVVEPGGTPDVDAVADLWVELADGQRDFGSNLLAAENRDRVREAITRSAVAGELLVAHAEGDEMERADPGDIVGFLTFAVESGTYEQDVTRGVVQNIYVVPDARSAGIGSDLLAEAERRMAGAGADVVSLEVMADNDAARRFYRRHGYSPHRVELEKSVESDTLTKE
jgi:ribosomal protein S18 acetylase RimI-like enzyme